MFDDFEKDAFKRTGQTGSEKRVDDDVVSPTWFCDLFPRGDAFAFDERQWRWSLPEIRLQSLPAGSLIRS